jgi:hypothetical protein
MLPPGTGVTTYPKVGETVEVYSKSLNTWIPATVTAVVDARDVVVHYSVNGVRAGAAGFRSKRVDIFDQTRPALPATRPYRFPSPIRFVWRFLMGGRACNSPKRGCPARAVCRDMTTGKHFDPPGAAPPHAGGSGAGAFAARSQSPLPPQRARGRRITDRAQTGGEDYYRREEEVLRRELDQLKSSELLRRATADEVSGPART